MKTNKLLALTGVIALGCTFVAHAENIAIIEAATGLNSEKAWGTGHPTADDDCWVYTHALKGDSGNATFNGRSLNIGSSTTSWVGILNTGTLNLSAKTYTINSLVWWSGIIRANFSDKTVTVKGNCTVRQADGAAAHDLPIAKGGGNATIAANLSTEESESPVIAMSVTATTPTLEQMDAGNKSVFTLSGTNSAYAGAYDVQTPYATLRLSSATAIGNPAAANASAVILRDDAALSLGGDFAQNPSRGIEIAGTNAYVMAYEKADRTLAYPVSGEGTMTKRGEGKLTFAGNYAAGDIVVDAGTLEIAATATFSDAERTVTVNSGVLILKMLPPPTTRISTEGSGEIVYDLTEVVVPYDGDYDTMPHDLTTLADEVVPTNVALSTAFNLPFVISKKLDMLKLSEETLLTADDFADRTAKIGGLPRTSFEIESRDGFKMLMLKAEPVTVSVSNMTGINGSAENWDPAEAVVSGPDYLLTNTVTTTTETLETFAADSLTAHDVTIKQKNKPELCISNLFISGAVNFVANGGSQAVPLLLTGEKWTFVDADATLKVQAFKGSSAKYSQDLAAPLAGAGQVMMSVNKAGAGLSCTLSGDNSEFTGTITTECEDSLSWDKRGITLKAGSSEALGGMTGWDKITLTDYALFQPTGELETLDQADRGWFFDNGGFNIPKGRTLTFLEKFKLSSKSTGGDMAKFGDGTLSLGGHANLGKTNKKKFYVYGGAVKILADKSVNYMNFVMTNDTSIVLSTDAVTTNGVFGSVKPMVEGEKIKVAVEGEDPVPEAGLPICTVSTSHVDLLDVFVQPPAPAKIVKETVTIDEVDYVRYLYKAAAPSSGFMMIVR